jgi:hypothetical protein
MEGTDSYLMGMQDNIVHIRQLEHPLGIMAICWKMESVFITPPQGRVFSFSGMGLRIGEMLVK